jgi:hypothetical protein
MPENVSTGAPPHQKVAVPEPISPREGATVDVKAVAFEWSQVEGRVEYILQVARDAEFDDVVVAISAGETTAVTLYHTLDAYADTDLYWRVRAGERGSWGPAASFHAAGADRLTAERAQRERAAQAQVRATLERHLEGEHRMPVVLPDETDSDRRIALILGLLVMSFVILIVILFMFGWITYPAEAQV